MQEVASLFAKVSAQTNDYDRSMRGVRDDLVVTENAMSKFGEFGVAAFKAVAVAAVAIGAGVVAGVGAAIKGAASMEQGVANIGASMQLTAEDTAKLQDYILDLGLDPNLVVDAQQASEAIGTLGTAGLDLQQIMNGAAESTILLSNATGGSFAGSAALMTDLMSQFNVKAEDTSRILDQVTGLTVATKFGFEDVAGAFAQVGGVAGALGLTLEDTTAILAVTSSNFASGSDAATSMKTFLQRLVPTTKEASSAMARLNLLNEDGTSKFFDATGAMKSSEEIATLLQGALGELSDAQRIEAASTIFGTDAMRTAFGLMEGGQSAIMDAKKLIGDTDAQEMATKRMDTLSGAWQIFRGVIDTVSLGIGEKFLPVVRKAVEWLTDLAQKWGPRVIDFFGVLADRMTTAFEDVGAAIATFRAFFSLQLGIITSDNATWGEKLSAIWDMVAMTGSKLWKMLIENLAAALPTWLEALAEWATAAWEWLVDSIPQAVAKLGEWAVALWDWLVTNLPTWISKFADWAVATWQWIVDVTPTVIEKLGEWGTALYSWLSTNLPMWVTTLGTWATAAWQWITTATPIVVTKLSQWASALWGWLKTNAPTWAQKLGEWGKAAWQWIVDAVPVVLAKLGEWGAALWGWLVANSPAWVKSLAAWALAAWQWVVDATQPLRTALGNLWAQIDFFINQFKMHWAMLDATNASVMDRLKIAWYALQGVFAVVSTAINTWLESISGGFLHWSDIAIGAVLALTIMFWPAISAAFGAVLGAIGAFVAAWAPILALFAAAIIAVALVRTAWETDWMGIKTATLAALDFMGKAFGPFLDVIKQFGVDALKEIVAWVTGNKTNFEAVKKIWNAAKTAFGTILDAIVAKIVEWGQAAWSWFQDKFPKASEAMIGAVNKIKANFDEFWKVLEPLIQKMKDEFDRYRENWEKNSGKMGSALETLRKLADGIFAILSIAISAFINNAINVFTLFIQFVNGDWAGAWATIIEIGQTTWDAVLSIVGIALDGLLGLFNLSLADIKAWLEATAVRLGEWATAFQAWLTGLRDGAKTKMEELKNNVVTPIAAFVDATKTKVGEWKDWFVQKYVELGDAIRAKMDALKSSVIDPVAQFIEDTKTKIEGWKTEITNKYEAIRSSIVTKMEAIKTGVIDPIKAFVEETALKVEGWKTTLLAIYESIRHNVVTKMEAIKTSVVDPIKAFIEDTKERILSWRDTIVGYWDMLKTNVLDLMTTLKTNVVEPVKAFIQDTKDRIDEWRMFLIEKWAAIKDKVKEYMDLVKQYVIDPIVSFVTTTKEKIVSWKDWLVDKFEQVRDSLKEKLDPQKWLEWGRDLIEGFRQGIKEKWDSFVNWFSGTWDGLVHSFQQFFGIHSPSTVFQGLGSDLMSGLQVGINAAATLPLNAMDGLATSIQGKVTNMVNAVKNSAGAISNAIPNIGTPAPTPTNAPPTGGIPMVIPSTMTAAAYELAHFGEKNVKTALAGLEGLGDLGNFLSNNVNVFGKFAVDAANAIYAATGTVIDRETQEAVVTSQYANNQQVGQLLGAVHLLITKLSEAGLGQAPQFNISAAPGTEQRDDIELRNLVAYLQALYA